MNRIKPLLIKIFLIYWIFALVLYEYGPFDWITYNPHFFWGLNFAYILMALIGWLLASRISLGKSYAWSKEDNNGLLKRLPILIYINFVFLVINLFRIFRFSDFDIFGLIKRIIYGLYNMGASYNDYQDVKVLSSELLGGKVLSLFNYVWEIWAFSTLLFGILYFKKLRFHVKTIAILCVVLEVINYLSRGTNIGVFRIILAFVVFYFIKYNRKKMEKIHKRNDKKLKYIVLFLVGVVLAVAIFYIIMIDRGGINSWESSNYNIGGVYIDVNSVFFKIVPLKYHKLLVALSGYITQGLYGMSLCLLIPWKPMYGIGFSMFLQDKFGEYMPRFVDMSYQNRIEQFGWENGLRWNSMYTWFANDVSFFGVLFIMFLYGWILYKSLYDSINLNNPFAKIMLYYMVLMGIFLPCNNQIAQTSYILFSFIYIFIKWQCSKHHFIIIIGNRSRYLNRGYSNEQN